MLRMNFRIVAGKPVLTIPADFPLRPKFDDGDGTDDLSEYGQAELMVRLVGDQFIYNDKLGLLWYDGIRWKNGARAAARMILGELTEAQAADQLLDESRVRQDSQALQEQVNAALSAIEVTNYGSAETTEKAEKLRELYQQSVQKSFQENLNPSKRYQSFINQMRRRAKIDAVIDLFETLVKQVTIDDLDADEFLLNAPSYTLNMNADSAGGIEQQEHNPSDLLTKVTTVDPSDDPAEMKTYLEFLETIQKGKPEVVRALQVIAGAVLIGHVYEERLIVAEGSGGNGKSTLFNLWLKVLSGLDGDNPRERGAYADIIDSDLLVKDQRHGDAYKRFSRGKLQGLRLAIAGETEEGAYLDGKLVKQISSTDPIEYEIKFVQDHVTFRPSHVTILHTNHKPRIVLKDGEQGLTDRIIVIPFTERIRYTDGEKKDYAEELFTLCGGAVLTWMIEGAREFIRRGFKYYIPAEIRKATDDFIAANDALALFVKDMIEDAPGQSVTGREIMDAYKRYCESSGNLDAVDKTYRFNQRLDALGIRSKRTKFGQSYLDIVIRADKDEDADNPFIDADEMGVQ